MKQLKENIKKDYLLNFMSNTDLAIKYCLHRTTVQRYLKSMGVKLRKKTPETKVNHFFFSKYNQKSCYWAGFILADGYIRKNRFTLAIKLQKTDVGHLEKFKKDIGFFGRIIEEKTYVSISISSSQLIADLENNFGIKNKKSLTCEISNKIPKTFLHDYIRGYFDGDGSITFTSTDTINFLGTKKTISFIRDYFYEVGVKLRSKDKPDICINKNIFTINYSGVSAYNCLFNLYDNCTQYLDRKMILFKKIKKKYESKFK